VQGFGEPGAATSVGLPGVTRYEAASLWGQTASHRRPLRPGQGCRPIDFSATLDILKISWVTTSLRDHPLRGGRPTNLLIHVPAPL
jgi:hypothetical protein